MRAAVRRVMDCACCGRTRGNVSRHLFCLRPNKSSKSGRSSPGSANDSANRLISVASSLWLDSNSARGQTLQYSISQHHKASPASPKPNSARAKWVFARRICSPPPAGLPMANSIWNGCAHLPQAEARGELMTLRGVGGKIADCVLLFAYGFDGAFPVDVWVERALRELYFPRRRVGDKRLRHFAATHFGPHAGYAQQYLFHYMRTKKK